MQSVRVGFAGSVALLLLTALAVPLVADAQRGAVPRLGVLLFGTPATDPNLRSFADGLRELGYVEGKNIVLEYRFAEGKPERLPGLARELVSLEPTVIFALGGDVTPIVKTATATIPVVFVVSLDPVQTGLVAGLARPGGNLTGVTMVSADLAPKRLEFLREAAPGLSRVGVLWTPAHPDLEYRATLVAGERLGIQVQSLEVDGAGDFEAAFRAAASGRAQAVIVASSRLMTLNQKRIVELAAAHKLMLVSGWGPWAQAGALLSYGPDLDLIARRAASHVDRVLKGARPGDLPVEQPTKFEIVLNLKTARAHGLTIPPALAARADRVIDP
jgi:putative tryptophan/tyrosine transport system substrate-binding protein